MPTCAPTLTAVTSYDGVCAIHDQESGEQLKRPGPRLLTHVVLGADLVRNNLASVLQELSPRPLHEVPVLSSAIRKRGSGILCTILDFLAQGVRIISQTSVPSPLRELRLYLRSLISSYNQKQWPKGIFSAIHIPGFFKKKERESFLQTSHECLGSCASFRSSVK